MKKLALLALEISQSFFPFHFIGHLSFPLFRFDLPMSSMVLLFPLYSSSLSSLPSMVLPFPLYSSRLSSVIFSPCPWEVFSTTLGCIFNYPGEYVQLPWGVFSTTFGSICIYPGILGNIVKSKCFARGRLKQNTKNIERERRRGFRATFF